MAAVPDPPCTIPTHLLGLTTTHILRSSRFAACSTTAHAALTTVLERYLAVLAGACVRAAGEAGRARPSAWDVMRVVQEFGGELEELELWARGNADEEGRTGRIGVVGGMEVLRDHLKAGLEDPPMRVPLVYRRVRQRAALPTASSRSATSDSDEAEAEADSDAESFAPSSTSSRKRKRSRSAADSDGSLAGLAVRAGGRPVHPEPIDLGSPGKEAAGDTDADGAAAMGSATRHATHGQRAEHILPWLPAVPAAALAPPAVPAAPGSSSPTLAAAPPRSPAFPGSPMRLHSSPRPRDTRSVSYAPTTPGGPSGTGHGLGGPLRPPRSALHAYLAPPVPYAASRLGEAAEPGVEASFRALSARVARPTPTPDLLPSTLPYLVDAYDALAAEERRMTPAEADAAKGPFDHRLACAEILARTSNHPLAYCGTSVPGIGGPRVPGPASRGSHVAPAFPVLEDGTTPAENAYPVKRVAAGDRAYVPRLAYEPHGHAAPLSNPTDPDGFRPLHALLSELPGRTALTRAANGQTWFEPHGRRSEWLTPDVLELATTLAPPPPLVGKAGTAEEGRRLLYGESVPAPGWTRDMRVWRQWRMDDGLPSNVIPPDIAVCGSGPTRQPVSAIMGIDPVTGAQQDAQAKPAPPQPPILLRAAWDTKDRGNWRVWIKPKSSSKSGGRGRILSKQDGQTLDVNVKGEDVEEELDEEDEETVAGTPAPQVGPSEGPPVPQAMTPGPRIKLNARPSLSLDTPGALMGSTPGARTSFSMGPPMPPPASASALQMSSGQGTPAPFKLKFKLGAGLGTPGHTPMDSPSPAFRASSFDAVRGSMDTRGADGPRDAPPATPAAGEQGTQRQGQPEDYFSMEASAPAPASADSAAGDERMSPTRTS